MPSKAFDPHSSQQEETAKLEERAANEDRKDEDTVVREAIGRAIAKIDDQEPLMTQLCRISAEVDKAKKAAKSKQSEEGKIQSQTRDPRNLREVLVQEGIEPHPGPAHDIRKHHGCGWACRALATIVGVSAMLNKATADNRVGADEIAVWALLQAAPRGTPARAPIILMASRGAVTKAARKEKREDLKLRAASSKTITERRTGRRAAAQPPLEPTQQHAASPSSQCRGATTAS